MLDENNYRFTEFEPDKVNAELNKFIKHMYKQSYAYKDDIKIYEEQERLELMSVFTNTKIKIMHKILEEYFSRMGEYPNHTMLERIANLILFQEMTDNNPHKASKDFSFHSKSQERARGKKQILVADLFYETTTTPETSSGNYEASSVVRDDAVSVSNVRREIIEHTNLTDLQIELALLVEQAELTDLQYSVIQEYYFLDQTFETIAKAYGVEHPTIVERHSSAIKKLQEVKASQVLQSYL